MHYRENIFSIRKLITADIMIFPPHAILLASCFHRTVYCFFENNIVKKPATTTQLPVQAADGKRPCEASLRNHICIIKIKFT